METKGRGGSSDPLRKIVTKMITFSFGIELDTRLITEQRIHDQHE
jgi:hypothetical protein